MVRVRFLRCAWHWLHTAAFMSSCRNSIFFQYRQSSQSRSVVVTSSDRDCRVGENGAHTRREFSITPHIRAGWDRALPVTTYFFIGGFPQLRTNVLTACKLRFYANQYDCFGAIFVETQKAAFKNLDGSERCLIDGAAGIRDVRIRGV